jgi:hypothetical protein
MPRLTFPQRLWDILEDQFTLMPDYSGRGMYGRTCIALVGNTGDLLRFAAELAQIGDDTDTDTDAADMLQIMADTVRTDSLGYDTVFYFPGITLEPEAADDHDQAVPSTVEG